MFTVQPTALQSLKLQSSTFHTLPSMSAEIASTTFVILWSRFKWLNVFLVKDVFYVAPKEEIHRRQVGNHDRQAMGASLTIRPSGNLFVESAQLKREVGGFNLLKIRPSIFPIHRNTKFSNISHILCPKQSASKKSGLKIQLRMIPHRYSLSDSYG